MQQRPRLSLRLRTQTRITREVQLALRYLQTPALELAEELARVAGENPLLEIEDEQERFASAPALPRGRNEPWPEDRESVQRYEPGMQERLVAELRLFHPRSKQSEAAEYLIGCLDERGYLGASLEDLAADLRISVEVAETALSLVQTLDPPGIGARDLRECFLLQLERQGDADSATYRIVRDSWPLLVGARGTRSVRPSDRDLLDSVRAHLRRLAPHPGWQIAVDPVPVRIADVRIERIEGAWTVSLPDTGFPRVHRGWAADSALAGQARAAHWLVETLERRRQTIIQVTRAIVEEQVGYLERGLEGLKPLTLQAIARRVGVHESTVARVAKDKYADTPRGIVPLRFFFSGGVATASGGALSSRLVEARIRALVTAEDPAAPLSDQDSRFVWSPREFALRVVP